MTKYLEELLKEDKIALMVNLLNLKIINLNNLIKEAIKSNNSKYIYNTFRAVQEYGKLNAEEDNLRVITISQIAMLGEALIKTADSEYLKLFLENSLYGKINVLEFLLTKEDPLDLKYIIEYLLKTRGNLSKNSDMLKINKSRAELLKKAIQKLIRNENYEVLENLVLTADDYFFDLVLEVADSKFLKRLQITLTKIQRENTITSQERIAKIKNNIPFKELAEGIISDETKFALLEELCQNNDITPILDNKESFAALFEDSSQKGLTK